MGNDHLADQQKIYMKRPLKRNAIICYNITESNQRNVSLS